MIELSVLTRLVFPVCRACGIVAGAFSNVARCLLLCGKTSENTLLA
jgi:hypothetical protein